MAALEALVGLSLHDVYRIVRLIGKGGMGAIYEAEHLRLAGKRYAVKVLHRTFAENPELLQRFRREAEIASALGHDNIVEVHDFNVTGDGLAYIVMELLQGEDLAARLKQRGPLPLDAALSIAGETASALDAAHRAHIVHRDLKPQNLFLCRRGGRDDFVKVLDFGVSKVLDSSSVITHEHALVGTPFYMSPEQADGRVAEIEARTDVFALGAIVWEMLTGQMAFGGPSHSAVLYRVSFVDPPEVHTLRPDVPPAVSLVLRRALVKDRLGRTPSVMAFAEELSAAARGVAPAAAASLPPGYLSTLAAAPPAPTPAPLPAPAFTPAPLPPPVTSPAPMETERVEPARRARVGWVVAAVGLVAGAVAGTLWWRGRTPGAPVAAPAPATPVSPAPAPAPAPAPPSEARITFDVKPAGAVIKVNGTAIDGKEARVPRGTAPVEVTVEAKGYQPERRSVVPDQDREVDVALRRKALPLPPPAPPKAAVVVPPPPPPAPQVIVPDARPPEPPPKPPKKRTGTVFDN